MQISTTNLPKRSSWSAWAALLNRTGLNGFVSWLIDTAGPFSILGAQVLHFSDPFLRSAMSPSQLADLISLLEEDDEGRDFIKYLREKESA
jgi:hypothetical protein